MRVRAAAARHPARLYLFDALSLDGEDLRALPLVERKSHLREAFTDTKTLIFANGIVGAGEWVFEQAQALDLEGMVAKRLSSPYQRGRSLDWLKIKNADYGRPAALGWGRVRRRRKRRRMIDTLSAIFFVKVERNRYAEPLMHSVQLRDEVLE